MTSDTPRPPMTQSEPVLTALRTYQCPGCWSVTQNPLTAGGYECECGERLTVIDLRAAQSPVQPVLTPDVVAEAEARSVWDDEPIEVRRVIESDGLMLLVVGPFTGPRSPVQPVLSGLDPIMQADRALALPHRDDDQACGCDECMAYGAEDEGADWYRLTPARRIVLRSLDSGDDRLAPIAVAFREHEEATAPAADEALREAIEDIAGKVYYVGNVDGHEVARRLRAALANPATPNPEQDRCTCPPDDEVFTAGCPVHDGDLR